MPGYKKVEYKPDDTELVPVTDKTGKPVIDEKTGKQKLRRSRVSPENMVVRRQSYEIVDIFGFNGVDKECTKDLDGLKKTLQQMGKCAARAMTTAATTLWLQSGAWVYQVRDEDKEAVEEAQKETAELFGSSAPNMLKNMCPCMSSNMTDVMGQELLGKFRAWNKTSMNEKRGTIIFKPPAPLRIRGRAVDIRVDPDSLKDVKVEIPVRTSVVCAWAKEQMAKREQGDEKVQVPGCLRQSWDAKTKDGGAAKKVVVPIRGAEGKTARVIVRAKSSCRRNRIMRSQEVLQGLLSGEYMFRDVTIRRQGPDGGKQCWMLDITYRMPVKPAKGQTAVACFSQNRLLYMVAEDSSKFGNIKADPILCKQFQFLNQLKSAEEQEKAGEALLKHIREEKDKWFHRQRRANATAHFPSEGAQGHGAVRRHRDVALMQAGQAKWVEWASWNIAHIAMRWCAEHKVNRVLFVPWKDPDIENIPRERRHLILRFPRYAIKEKLGQLLEKAGGSWGVVEKKGKDTAEKKKGKGHAALSRVACPECASPLEWVGPGYTRCPEESCSFQVDFDLWTCLLAMADAGIPAGNKMIKQLRRTVKETRTIMEHGTKESRKRFLEKREDWLRTQLKAVEIEKNKNGRKKEVA